MIKPKYKELKPVPEKEMPEDARIANKAMKRAMRKLRAEHKRLNMPLISWEDGKVVEVQP